VVQFQFPASRLAQQYSNDPETAMKQMFWSAVLAGLLIRATVAWPTPSDDCRQVLHKRIDQLDAIMRHGYGGKRGESLRETRNTLSDLRAQCDRDPDAWKRAPKP
jgi:hypothetical protein